ncbi:MAG: hypothetical protein H0X34_04490 [Chthoniobacterales bacterium]|nr:hypothetical protein [Chthoniobacterales bacterium]
MKTENQEDSAARNPFDVRDVPDPDGHDVTAFALTVEHQAAADDVNAPDWSSAGSGKKQESIEGDWSARWNGGADPTIAGDTADKWKQGKGEVKIVGDRVYLLFDWDNGARTGLIDTRRDGSNKLIGRYINLGDPSITRPWIGLIVNNHRIDGIFPEGRLDFRR